MEIWRVLDPQSQVEFERHGRLVQLHRQAINNRNRVILKLTMKKRSRLNELMQMTFEGWRKRRAVRV